MSWCLVAGAANRLGRGGPSASALPLLQEEKLARVALALTLVIAFVGVVVLFRFPFRNSQRRAGSVSEMRGKSNNLVLSNFPTSVVKIDG